MENADAGQENVVIEQTVNKRTKKPKKERAPRKQKEARKTTQAVADYKVWDQRSPTAINIVRILNTLEGVDAYIKLKRVGTQGTNTVEEGVDFDLHPNKKPRVEKENEQPSALLPELVTAVTVAATKAAVTALQSFKEPKPLTPFPIENFPSPTRGSRQGNNSCVTCKKTKNDADDFDWIGCSVPICLVWTHTDCLGFSSCTMDDLVRMPEWFCPNHIKHGKQLKNRNRNPENEIPEVNITL